MCVARTAARQRRRMKLDKRYVKHNRQLPKGLSGRAKLQFQNSLTRNRGAAT